MILRILTRRMWTKRWISIWHLSSGFSRNSTRQSPAMAWKTSANYCQFAAASASMATNLIFTICTMWIICKRMPRIHKRGGAINLWKTRWGASPSGFLHGNISEGREEQAMALVSNLTECFNIVNCDTSNLKLIIQNIANFRKRIWKLQKRSFV